MKYTTVYPWMVIDEIRKGKKIFVLDRKLKNISYVNDASIEDVLRATEETEKDRYEFWYEEPEKVTEVTEETEENENA